ncbi:uncharacterized protein LOC135392025 [Ornithodoros turicata]|uniref:uncharacterized protein LOC135392025 n=1 Tax=Ornithodoros turicata TaxID=34597 RepID=UPI003138CDAD
MRDERPAASNQDTLPCRRLTVWNSREAHKYGMISSTGQAESHCFRKMPGGETWSSSYKRGRPRHLNPCTVSLFGLLRSLWLSDLLQCIQGNNKKERCSLLRGYAHEVQRKGHDNHFSTEIEIYLRLCAQDLPWRNQLPRRSG